MRCLKRLTLVAALAIVPILPSAGHAQATDNRPAASRPRSAAPSPAPSAVPEQGPSAVERLNRSLNPGSASDPDVPLPHPDLAHLGPAGGSRNGGTQVYGRQEEGGGVLGLRMPIPVDRGAVPTPTTSSGSSGAPGAAGVTSQAR